METLSPTHRSRASSLPYEGFGSASTKSNPSEFQTEVSNIKQELSQLKNNIDKFINKENKQPKLDTKILTKDLQLNIPEPYRLLEFQSNLHNTITSPRRKLDRKDSPRLSFSDEKPEKCNFLINVVKNS